jgi:hypothetical protein
MITPLHISSSVLSDALNESLYTTKPLPPLPGQAMAITPQGITMLLNLLDDCDDDVVIQVARIEQNIKETRESIFQCRQQRAKAAAQLGL